MADEATANAGDEEMDMEVLGKRNRKRKENFSPSPVRKEKQEHMVSIVCYTSVYFSTLSNISAISEMQCFSLIISCVLYSIYKNHNYFVSIILFLSSIYRSIVWYDGLPV